MQSLTTVAADNLLTISRALAKARGSSLARVSRMCYGNSYVLDNIAARKISITAKKYDAAMVWLLNPENWPEGSKIPKPPWRWRRDNTGATNGKEEGKRSR